MSDTKRAAREQAIKQIRELIETRHWTHERVARELGIGTSKVHHLMAAYARKSKEGVAQMPEVITHPALVECRGCHVRKPASEFQLPQRPPFKWPRCRKCVNEYQQSIYRTKHKK
jgi:hypothetical protein